MLSLRVVLFILFQLYIQFGNGSKLVVLNGYSSKNKVELIDLETFKSTLLADYPGDENGEGQAWLLVNSSILTCGGSYTKTHFKDCSNPNCYEYSMQENSWSELKNQPKTQIRSGIYGHIPNVGPIVLGGYLNGVVTIAGCRFNPTRTSRMLERNNEWKDGPETPKLFYHGCSADIDKETTYVAANQQAFIINWNTLNFSKVSPIKEAPNLNNRVYMACAFDPNSGKVIIAGGEIFNLQGSSSQITKSVKLYDPLTDTYEDGPDLPQAITGSSLTLVGGKDIILAGGEIGFQHTRSADLLKYSPEGWIKLPVSLKYPRVFHTAIALP